MNILLTAFEAFGGKMINSSEQTLSAFPDKMGEINIHKVLLLVSFRRCFNPIAAHPALKDVGLIVALGQAGSRRDISLEHTAVNIADAKSPDNDGFSPRSEKIIEEAPSFYNTVLPADIICESMKSYGIACHVSEFAGRYVCNTLYFRLLHFLPEIPSIFIHLPCISDKMNGANSATSGMQLEEMIRAIEAAIRTIIPLLHNKELWV